MRAILDYQRVGQEFRGDRYPQSPWRNDRWRTPGLVLGEAARLAAIGVALGLVLAWIAVRRFQPGTAATGQDHAVYVAAAVLALIAALFSAYVPARRAASVSPQEALRS